MALPRRFVAAPQRTPLPYGLFSVVDFRTDGDPHWRMGMEWESVCGDSATALDYCVTGAPLPAAKVETGEIEHRGSTSFTVYAEIDCAPVGRSWERGIEDVRTLLEQTAEWSVEQAFWTGTAAGVLRTAMPHLASASETTDGLVTLQTAATIVTGLGGPVTAPVGVGLLEKALADCYKGTSVLHVPLVAIPSLMHRGIISRNGSQLRTVSGNIVVAGGGYANTSPSGTAAPTGQAWLYGTGLVFGYRSGITVFDRASSLNRQTNTLKMIAEQTFTLGFECCHHAVLINI